MPLAVETIRPDEPVDSVRKKISASMAICLKEPGMTPDKCAGKVYGMAEKAWGKPIPSKR